MASLTIIDVADPGIFTAGHPHASYDRQRSIDPVGLNPAIGDRPAYWVVTGHDAVQQVSRNNRDWTSMKGSRLFENGGLVVLPERIRLAVNSTLTGQDPPHHGELRKPLAPSFLPSAIRRVEGQVEAFVEAMISDLAGQDEIEFVSQVAAVVPIRTLCFLLGVPLEDEQKVFDWTNAMVGTSDPEYAASPDVSVRAFEEVFDFGAHLIARRRENPQDDMLSVVAHMTVDGKPLDPIVQDAMFMSLLAAGNETTRNSLTGSILALSQHPDQRKILADDPSLVDGALDELQRFVSPVIQMKRTAVAPVELGGHMIEPDQQVVMLYGAANRDPAVFADPHKLDVRRANANRQLSFGIGIHHCLGAPLARLQLRILLKSLLKRYPNITASGDPDFLRSNFVAGIKKMKVRLA